MISSRVTKAISIILKTVSDTDLAAVNKGKYD